VVRPFPSRLWTRHARVWAVVSLQNAPLNLPSSARSCGGAAHAESL